MEGNCYVFPGASSQTVFSIALSDNTGTTSYSYTYLSPLSAATLYKIKGNYSDNVISLSASFISEGWKTPIDLSFNFGPGGSSQSQSQTDTAFPKAGSVWNGHLVGYVYSDDGTNRMLSSDEMAEASSVNLLLLSLSEWTGVYSAYNEDAPNDALNITDRYSEGDISGWQIPTEDEAKNLKSLYNVTDGTLAALNSTIAQIDGADEINPSKSSGNARFLCGDAKMTFDWKSTSKPTKAGASVEYSLRLVNHVKVTRK